MEIETKTRRQSWILTWHKGESEREREKKKIERERKKNRERKEEYTHDFKWSKTGHQFWLSYNIPPFSSLH